MIDCVVIRCVSAMTTKTKTRAALERGLAPDHNLRLVQRRGRQSRAPPLHSGLTINFSCSLLNFPPESATVSARCDKLARRGDLERLQTIIVVVVVVVEHDKPTSERANKQIDKTMIMI